MTILAKQAQDTRAKRRIKPSFRPHGGPLPHGKSEAQPIDVKNQKDQSNTWDRDNKEAHRTQASLAVFGGFPPFLSNSEGDPSRLLFDPNRLSGQKRRKSAIF